MRCLKRNLKPIYVCLFEGETDVVNSDGYKTGEKVSSYSNPIKIEANAVKIMGEVMAEKYGLDENYDRVVTFDNVELKKIPGFDEQSVLYIERVPDIDENGDPVLPVGGVPDNDYIVKSISTTLNSSLVLCKKVQ